MKYNVNCNGLLQISESCNVHEFLYESATHVMRLPSNIKFQLFSGLQVSKTHLAFATIISRFHDFFHTYNMILVILVHDFSSYFHITAVYRLCKVSVYESYFALGAEA
jgi:hypothetical protein